MDGQVLRAGTPIRRQGQTWTLNGATEYLPIAKDDKFCQAEYMEPPLHFVFREWNEGLLHQRVDGNASPQEVAPDKVVEPPISGTSSMCACCMVTSFYLPKFESA